MNIELSKKKMNRLFILLRYDLPLHFVLWLTNWFPDNVSLIQLRGWLASPFFKKAGKNLQIGRNVTFYNPSQIVFGNNVYVALGCWFSCSHGIEIGNNILFGPYVVIVTSNHSIKNGAYYWGNPVNCKKVIIKDGAWIAAHVTILPGAFVNKCVLVSANCVFSGESIPFGIYGGIPAKLIKTVSVNEVEFSGNI